MCCFARGRSRPGLFVVAAAQVGHHEDGRNTFGHSLVVDPWGEVLLDMGEEPGVGFADIDLKRISDVRSRIPALNHRRPIPEAVTIMIVFDLQCRDRGRDVRSVVPIERRLSRAAARAGSSNAPSASRPTSRRRRWRRAFRSKGFGNPLARLAAMQAEMLKNRRWVGDEFTDTARAMHNGEIEPRAGPRQGDPRAGQVAGRRRRAGRAAAASRHPAQPGQLIARGTSPYSSPRATP